MDNEHTKPLVELASAALSLWDMHVTDADGEEELVQLVSQDILGHGLVATPAEAIRVARMACAAFNTEFNAKTNPAQAANFDKEFKDDPLFRAMLDEITSGSWDI